ncbi:dihydrodipicolinate synthase 2 [Acidiphilium sp. CAG:727]|nr:dihydrodipicolinate synthase 2 [Acidiphilium sp. CAG:727]
MKKTIFEGVATALYTPFNPINKSVDYGAFSRLINRQLSANVNALVVLGTTGEAATITEEERREIIKFCVKEVNGRIPLIVGSGSNCTATAVKFSREAEESGADGLLVVTPYYNKCNDDGLYAHYSAGAKSTSLPIIVYNVPTRTGFNVKPIVYRKLAEIDNVVAIKEANCCDEQLNGVLDNVKDILAVYCGSDDKLIDVLRRGGKGTISVASNIIPSKIVDYIGDFENYFKTGFYKEIVNILQSDVNPIPLKYMVKLLYNEGYGLRLPLTEAKNEVKEAIYKIHQKTAGKIK